MPLHDLSYQRFDGRRTSRFERSFAMARTAGSLLLKRRAFLLLLAVSWIPALVRVAQIYVARQFPQAFPFVTVDAVLWQEFLSQQVTLLPVILVALYTGAGAISSDLSSGAFVIYLSKPIDRLDYIIGKAMPVMAALLMVTLVPALVLLLVHVFVAEDFELFATTPLLPVSVAVFSIWMCLYFTLAVLAISSLTRSARVAGAGFGAIALGSKIAFLGALSQLRLAEPPAFVSMIDATVDAGHVLFGNTASARAPFLSVAAMAALMTMSIVVLRWRLRSAELSS
jgi:ABC-type transport system involved in multi-copper enzyme maturation permease subunit